MFKLSLPSMVFFCLLAFAGYARPQEQVTVRGMVVSPSGIPVARASVRLGGTDFGTLTDAQGQFSFKAPAGDYMLQVACVGYVAIELSLQLKRDGGKPLPGAIIGFGAWGLFIWWVAAQDSKKRKQREREQLLEEYLRRQLRK